MKRAFIFILTSIMCIDIYSDSSYYYGFDEQISVTLVSNKLALYDDNLSRENIEDIISKYKLQGKWENNQLCIIENIEHNSQLFFSNTSKDISCLPVYLINDIEESY